MSVTPVVLCGGGGTRLWPRSRRSCPKPFQPLLGPRTLFQRTLDRLADPARFGQPIIVAGSVHAELVADQLDRPATLMIEPAARSTAPAIALAAHAVDATTVLLVCPSDHHIADDAAFADAVAQAERLAQEGWLVSLGIAPTAPETGYGYIRRGAPLAHGFVIDSFVEKPDLARATAFLADGAHFWNGGIFAFMAGRFLEELQAFRPHMAGAVAESMAAAARGASVIRPAAAPFSTISGESIDYAVMENTTRAAVVPVAMGWSDIGSWSALQDARPSDADGNSVCGAPAELVDCRNVMVDSDGPRVAVVGLEDAIIVVDGNDVLVTSRAHAQQVGALAAQARS
ncbi:mannose-1-phosphate guanylyltransferase [Erythrobacteraceae bacterium CFH 75059]|uniref:mannose-1-phosphate guanylyltransferase n=1 Tax=Qipengyuania thermophila TaxID=2509361 RepID=UPI001020C3D2|nr:sugar phosphate nucleotidyltransferase [Qipengyuania thermophila]TCD04801.1 mannose-1-phosphate guanylyltransferase [Erythrobacteraceae bacterium CFH 75059]